MAINNLTRIQNNQITDSTIQAQAKLAAGSITGNLLASTVTFNSNITILGNLTVANSYTQLNSINTYINDPVVVFNNNYVGSLTNYDIGILVNRNLASLGAYGSVNAFLGWSEQAQAFIAIATTETGTNVSSINNSGYANVSIGNLTAVSASINNNLTAGTITNSPISGSTGYFTTAQATNFSTANAIVTNGTATTLVVTNFSSGNAQITGGNITGDFNVSGTTGQFTNLSTANALITSQAVTSQVVTTGVTTNFSTANAVITGGSINSTPIGATTASTGAFTTASTTGNLTVGANMAITGNIVPSANVTYSLGTSANRFKDLYLSGSTLYLGAFLLSEDVNGNVSLTTGNGNRLTIVGTAANTVIATGNVVAPYYLGSIVGPTATITTSASITGTGASTTASTGALVVAGGVGIGGSLNVAGSAVIAGNLTVQGQLTAIQSQTLDVTDLNVTVAKGAATAAAANGAGLTVDGASATLLYTSATDTWNINKGLVGTTASLNSTLSVTGAATLSSTLAVTGATTLSSTLAVTGVSTLANVNATNGTFSGTLGVTGATTLGTLTVANETDTGNLTVGGGLQASAIGNVTPGTGAFTTLSTTGQSSPNSLAVTNNATVGGTLGVTGATTLAGLTAGATTLASSSVTGNETIGGTLGVTGATTLTTLSATNVTASGTLGVTGVSTLANVTAANVTTSGVLASATSTVSGNLYVGSAAILNGSKTTGYDVVVKGAIDNTLIWARPNATYDSVIIGNSATNSTAVRGAKLVINSSDSFIMPVGTNAQRPSSVGGTDTAGMMRFNTTAGSVEAYTGTQWRSFSTDFTIIADNQFTGTGSQTAFTLATAQTTASCIVSINGVVQIPTLAYSVSGTTLTFTEAPSSTDIIDVRMLTTTTTVFGVASVNGYMQLLTDNDGVYVYTGTNTTNVTTYWDTSGAEVNTRANVTTSTTGNTAIDSFSPTVYSSAEYLITSTISGTNIRDITKILVVTDGTNAYRTVYGVTGTAGNTLTTWSANVYSGNVTLWGSSANANTIYRVKKDYQAI